MGTVTIVPVKSNDPSYVCPSALSQMLELGIVRDCYAGTTAMRIKGREYLAKHPAEDEKQYDIRLKMSVFWNAFARTIGGLTGMIFRRNPVLGDDVPSVLKTYMEDCDLQDTHLDVFSKNICTSQILDGHTFVLVEMQQSVLAVNPNATRADERAANLRPYFVHYTKDQIINWQRERIRGKLFLKQVTLCEKVMEDDGLYGESEVTQYRVLRPGSWEIYREDKKAPGNYVLDSSGSTSLNYIPLVVFYSHRVDFMSSKPMLIDLAYENIRHYNMQSDLDHILHTANVPIIHGRGMEKKDLVLGNGIIYTSDGVEIRYIEHEGKAIGKAQEEIEKCKGNMAVLGMQALMGRNNIERTATESNLDSNVETSQLSTVARNLNDGLETCLLYAADYISLPQGGSVQVNREFGHVELDNAKVSQYSGMVAKDQLSLDTLWEMLRESEELPESFDPVIELQRIEEAKAKREAENEARLENEASRMQRFQNPRF